MRPGLPGCPLCVERRQYRNRADAAAHWSLHHGDPDTFTTTVIAPPTVAAVAALVEADLSALRSGHRTRTDGRILRLSTMEIGVHGHRVLPDPDCPRCAALPADGPSSATFALHLLPKPDENTLCRTRHGRPRSRRLGMHPEESYRLPGFPFTPFDPGARARWVWGYSFSRSGPVLVPENAAYYGRPRTDSDPGWFYECSSGCALGSSLTEAVFHSRSPIRPPRRRCRPHPAVPQWTNWRRAHQNQNDQVPDIRTRRLRPPTLPHPARIKTQSVTTESGPEPFVG